jgi:hypothetical protein
LFGRRICRSKIALLGLVLALGLAVPAAASAAVNVTSAPTISGSAVVGAKLTANGGTWTGPVGTTVGRIWLRCDSSSTTNCDWLDNATATTYTLTTADKGKWIRVVLYAYKDYDYDYMTSNATAVIAAAPTPTPTPTRTPTPTPTKTPTPTPTAKPAPPAPTPTPAPTTEPTIVPAPRAELAATPAPVAQPLPAVLAAETAATSGKNPASNTKMIRPYPTIRISGSVTKTGANVALLTVKAPKGVRITLTCSGRSCPLREVAQATALWHIPQFERELRAGTKLTITVTKRGYITKVTTITIRRGKGPARKDRCQLPGETRLIACPKR